MPVWTSATEDEPLAAVDESVRNPPVPVALARDRLQMSNQMSDIVVQRLLLAGLELQSARGLMDSHPAAEKVDAAIDSLDQAVRDIQDILFDIRRGHVPSG